MTTNTPQVQALPQASFLPPKEKAVNKKLTPVPIENKGNAQILPHHNDDKPGFGMQPKQTGLPVFDLNTGQGGLMAGSASKGGSETPPIKLPEPIAINNRPMMMESSQASLGGDGGANKQQAHQSAPIAYSENVGLMTYTGTPGASASNQQLNNNSGQNRYYNPTEYQTVTGGIDVPEANVPQTEFAANQYQSDGYTGIQGNTNYNYDPRSESLVQNQITGLLDPESDIMRKAIALGNGHAASRGLQSSSIGSEIALSSMIDKALPIAQQDAQTFANADQTGWQQSFTADQNNLNRTHDAAMFDKQGALQTNLQNNQFSFQNDQANADRAMQAEMQQLQYLQNLGMLDAQGQQRMQELNAQQGHQWNMQQNQNDFQLQLVDRQAELQKQRDELMNQFDIGKMDKQYLQELEKTKLEWEHDDAVFIRNLNGQQKLQYQNAVSDSYNKFLEQVALVYNNPNMTPEQQNAGVQTLRNMFNEQRTQLMAIYGYAGTGDNDPWDGPDGTPGTGPVMDSPVVNIPAAPGGSSGGGAISGGRKGSATRNMKMY